MRVSRLSLRLLLPAGLMLLVVLLGTLQYRWLGQVSEAERAQLQRSLSQRANEFAFEFDREIGLISDQLVIDAASLSGDPWPAVAERFDAWQSRALFPSLVRTVYLARSSQAHTHTLARWSPDDRRSADIEWPEHLDGVRRSLSASLPLRTLGTPGSSSPLSPLTSPGTLSTFTMSLSPIVDQVPALVLPVVTHTRVETTGTDMLVALRTAGTDFVIVELDRTVLVDELLATLVERYFPANDGDRYKVVVLDRSGSRLFARGLPDTETAAEELHVDASATFFTGSRFDVTARVATEARTLAWQVAAPARARPVAPVEAVSVVVQERSAGAVTATPLQTARVALSGWRVVLQHSAGSLDEAVARARTRNLITSYGVLGVLMVGVGLIIANARRSERLAAQQMEFVATVSHELRTPLAVIRSAAQNLSAGVVADGEQARRYGDLIETEGRRLTDMVEEVLEFSGIHGSRRPPTLKPVDISALMHDVAARSVDALSAAGMATDLAVDPDLPIIQADEDALRRALNNLIGNAIKYAADGRWLGIRVRHDRARQHDQTHDQVVIEVSDRGPGIDEGDRTHVFEPFYRGRPALDRQIHGNGLGLSVVARIADAHRGSIEVTSSPGGGSTFTLRLPVDH